MLCEPAQYQPHDLLRITDPDAVEPAPDPRGPARPGMGEALARGPWVVVRRDTAQKGLVPVGVRGIARAQRWAAFVPCDAVQERVSPRQLVDRPAARGSRMPAFAALARVGRHLAGRGLSWGPGGSVGFALATALDTVSAASDLDLVLYAPAPLPVAYVAELMHVLSTEAAPTRVDVQLLTPLGGVSASEYAAGRDVLLRTDRGPLIVESPWRQSPSQVADAALRSVRVSAGEGHR